MTVDPIVLCERSDTSSGPEKTLIQALEAQGKAESLSGRALAAACGIDHGQLVRVRAGRARFGPEACAGIVERYPRLRLIAARYLSERYGQAALTLLATASRLARNRGRVANRQTACR